jgi:hypothetical protein
MKIINKAVSMFLVVLVICTMAVIPAIAAESGADIPGNRNAPDGQITAHLQK